MNAEQADIIDQAIAWQLRLADAPEADWGDFIAWLEADPAHADAFDAIAMQDRVVGDAQFPEAKPEPVAANDNARGRWLWLGGGSVAAALMAALLVPSMLASRAAPYEVATRAGENRTIALGDGSSVEMSGGTTLKLDRNDPRIASLDRGEAVFHVRHDDTHPFVLTSGAVTIRDLGTVFNVARDGERLSVSVSEGSVMFQPDREALTLKAGDAISSRGDGSGVARSKVDPASVGSWRSGRLSFDGQSLGDVAATIERLYGVDVALEGGLSQRPFTGMVSFTGAADRDVPHLAELIGATWRREGNRWILSGRSVGSR